MTTVASFRHSEFETICAKCGEPLIAPEWSEFVSEGLRAFTEKTESRGSPAGTNRIQGSYWNGGQHGWRNRIRRICVGALLVRGKMALPSRKLRSNLE